ncbi:putative hybrid NRPS/PKS enzyme [Rhexocercosporidium sp. MPI-PUGE-AT-0058]|nr:putative hybrid NRPS/PKS enzyme [Rhexocercosporidium sp. MPI-PUGE-AT-0058]
MSQQGEPIAIIGSGCRFPGESNTPSQLWELLREPRNVAKKIPADRFNLQRFYHTDGTHHGTTNVTESYFIEDDIRLFDASFFSIPPAEAEPIDPQHRQLLEVVYEAVEAAGISIEKLQGSNTAVYVGLMCNDYAAIANRDFNFIPTYVATGTASSNASSRVSYFFDWHGPSMTIDTACSSSLVALHQAVQAIRSGASRVAVAAGTNLLLDPMPYVSESNLNMLSPTGRSRMWDADADGYARGEGVAAVILKSLADALADGDQIDCIIRETGVNQDGRTKGITMPSAKAQAALIRDTYARAGLDPTNKDERCQYFEAHGTGTPAGDPQEAEALSTAFFNGVARDPEDILYVGSVKTVIGHTEGTAGLAGILKACGALKNSTIPPNLLFNRLSPSVEPFYKNLQILTESKPWPKLAPGMPRRASINSFGFGGTNAHAILESYEPPPRPQICAPLTPRPSFTPFLLSSASEKGLIATVKSWISYLQSTDSINLQLLARTLSSRRSALSVKAAFVASSVEQLCSEIESKLKESESNTDSPLGVRSVQDSPTILGVFTGQGAQWATMGTKLISSFPYAREIIEKLDQSLASLPKADRPQWTIMEELNADSAASRLGEAALSQPLCTAVQIVLVDLLRAADVRFKAVVGHSSGEIAAAYTAGFITASDAIRIAYYRGVHAKLAVGADGKRGAMIAVGTTFDDAMEFCELEDFKGRLAVAASNSSASVTLSGDADAIEEAKNVFEEESKFARVLKVDTAYHSHHMLKCSDAYTKSLQACKIQISQPAADAPTWFSSVHGGTPMEVGDDLKASYWVGNMTNSVLFSQALENALEDYGLFSMGLEIGPHPALKGPTLQNIQDVKSKAIPYFGTLSRGKDDVEAFTRTLGSVWTSLGGSAVNFEALEKTCNEKSGSVALVTGLPKYQWDHDRVFWSESRIAKLFRTSEDSMHTLLGVRTTDGTAGEYRWTNVLKPKEIPWLSGHALQGQTVFPGTGYIGLAMEASMQIADGRPVKCIELSDLEIIKAIAIDDNAGTEILVTMTSVSGEEQGSDVISADFTSYSPASKGSVNMVINARGRVQMTLGEPVLDLLPPASEQVLEMADVDIDDFYAAMDDLGYGYAGPFKGLATLRRRLGTSCGTITRPPLDDEVTPMLFHPGMLDTSLQGMFAAFSAPGDGRLWSIHAPTGIRRVTLIPSLCGLQMPEEVAFECVVTDLRRNHIAGDVDVFTPDRKHKIIEVDGIGFVPFTAATENDDRHLFAETVWGLSSPDGNVVPGNERATPEEYQKAYDCDRVGYFYLRKLNEEFGGDKRGKMELQWHHEALLDFAAHIHELVLQEKHHYGKKEWITDTHEEMCALMDKYGNDADFNIMRAVGEHLAPVLLGETTILEHMTKDGRLDDYYQNALGFATGNTLLKGLVAQIAHKFPHMNMLEIGAGTGGATGCILEELGTAFSSYTYTDISSGFFEKAQKRFEKYGSRMVYKPLNIENDPVTQGFAEHSYDIVMAANVLHATKRLEETLTNARRLLKPGGYLVLLEIVECHPNGTGPIREGVVMGALPGWWIGKDDGRRYAPTVSLTRWNSELKKSGFAGIDTSTPLVDPLPFLASAFAAQAIDEDIKLIRRPLRAKADQVPIPNLILLGGSGLETSRWMEDIEDLLRPYCRNLIMAETLEDLKDTEIPPMCTVLSLADLDSPVLQGITEERWDILKRLFMASRNMLWITKGARCDDAYAAMMVGLCRSITYELSQIRLQLLDIDDSKMANPSFFVELLLKVQLTTQWEESPTPKNILWTMEPELMIVKEQLKILRVLPQKELNDRYNSAKRLIVKDVELASSVVSLEWTGPSYALREDTTLNASDSSPHSKVNVEYSMLQSLRTISGRLFISLGTDPNSGSKVLSVSKSNASTINVPVLWSTPATIGKLTDAQYLSLISRYLLTQQVLTMMPVGGTLVAHEPDRILASLLSSQVTARGSHVTFTTANSKVQKGWAYIHPRMPKRSLNALLPKDVSLFLDFSPPVTTAGSLGSRISATLPASSERSTLSSFIGTDSVGVSGAGDDMISRMLKQAATFASTFPLEDIRDLALEVVAPNEITAEDFAAGSFPIVQWRGTPTIPTMIEPVDNRNDLFKPNKTYWLVGLAGDLGQSICDWMIGHGARFIALTSRSTKVAPEWIQYHARRGVTISEFHGDITKFESMKNVYSKICSNLPEVAGVANGALILRDTAYPNMDLDSFTVVLKPKVDGTLHLDALFKDAPLDFFVAFSSIVATMGNSGQSAYSAANCFMKALIAQRQKRGLAGSVIDISRVLGVGYVEREKKSTKLTEKQIARIMNVTAPMSEADLHQLFGEAVVAGRPNSGKNVELITGPRILTSDSTDKVFWAANIKFSHFIQDLGDNSSGKGGKEARIPVKTQLLSATSNEDKIKILTNAFITKLKAALQVSDEQGIRETMPLTELGVDSLVAVEIRTWVLQEMVIDLPVLKILGGASIADLVEACMEKIGITDESTSDKPAVTTPAVAKASSEDGATTPSVSGSSESGVLVDSVIPSSSPNTSGDSDSDVKAKKINGVAKSADKIKSQRVIMHAQPMVTRSEPVLKKIDPVVKEREPAIKKPDPVVTKRKPVVKKTEPAVKKTEAPVKVTEPVIREREPVDKKEPMTQKPEAEVKKAEPFVRMREPVVKKTEQEAKKPEKILKKIAPVVASAQPAIVRTEPMSYGQSRFWFLKQYLEDKTTSNITFWFQVKGNIQADRLRNGLDLVCQNHESLRTCFFATDNEAHQGIMERSAIKLEQKKISGYSEMLDVFDSVKKHSYNIEKGDTLRMVLCEESASNFYLIVGYHHITIDGLSWEILFSNLEKAYNNGSLPPVQRQYNQWAANQRKAVESGEMDTERKFWREEFANLPPVLPLLPMSHVSARKPLKRYEHHKISIKLDASLTVQIKERCRSQNVSPFHFHLAVFKTLLFRFTSIDDLCIGIADTNRTAAEDAGVIGFMLNLLPLRFKSSGTQNFIAALKEVRTKVFAALAHSKVPFNVVLEDIGASRNSTHSPIFQAFMDYRQAYKATFADFEGYAPLGSTSYSRTAYDVALNVLGDFTGESIVTVGAQTSLYSDADTRMLANSYVNLLEVFVKHPSSRVANPQLFGKGDLDNAIVVGRGPSFVSTWPLTVVHRVDEMISKYANEAAVKDVSGSLTYAQLGQRINSIASALINSGVTEDSIVAVFQSPSTEWICSMLAIMRVGATYAPLDYRNGLARLSTIVKTCQPKAVLLDSTTLEDARSLELGGIQAIYTSALKDLNSSKTPNLAIPDQAAIVLFTSGTTGVSKGIRIKHSSVRNAIESLTKVYNVGREIVLQQTAFSFDLSIDEIFTALCNGGTLYVVDKARRGDSKAIMEVIASEGITYTRATPPEYASWIRHGADSVAGNTVWKFAFAGGDRLTKSVWNDFRKLGLPQLKLFNSYGPTEVTMAAVKIEVPLGNNNFQDKSIPIGVPMPHYSIHILGQNLKPLPLGMPGEIVVGGAGVSLGYLNNEQLTDEKFLNNPFASEEYIKNGWTKMYRTGDKGHLNSNGTVIFHGRIEGDTQIKLRGIRIELGDIESTILAEAHGALSDVVCTMRGDPAFLVAHAVFSSDFIGEADERKRRILRQLLKRLPLPEYMKPMKIFPLDAIPLTTHQKTDRKAISILPISEIAQVDEETAGDSIELTELESQIKRLWQEVLPKEMSQGTFAPSTEFFQVGGNSLLLVEIQALIRTAFNVAIPLLDLFEAKTIGKLAAKVEQLSLQGAIDWSSETCPPEKSSVFKAEARPLKIRGMEVLLTGATGHLGRHLLPLLLADHKITKVHCVAVRDPKKVASTSNKLVVHTGDLSSDSLGLSPESATSLASSVDAMIHLGAQRSFWEPYPLLRRVNVHSTRELLRLAGSRKIPIYFLSSGGILRGATAATPSTAAPFAQFANTAEGYLTSKWVSEQMLERANVELKVPVHIYRTTTTPASTQSLETVPRELLDDFAHFSLLTKSLPEGGAWSGTFDLVRVGDVAKGVSASVVSSEVEDGVKFEHFPAEVKIGSMQQMELLMRRPEIVELSAGECEVLPITRWMGRLKATFLLLYYGELLTLLDTALSKALLDTFGDAGWDSRLELINISAIDSFLKSGNNDVKAYSEQLISNLISSEIFDIKRSDKDSWVKGESVGGGINEE